jgi:hypothetical protein
MGKERKMSIAKSLSSPGDSRKQPDAGRRSFMWKAGAAVSAALASAVPGMSSRKSGQEDGSEAERLANRLGILEDENSIRALHRNYETLLDSSRYEEVVELFAEDAEVVFNGGIYQGRKNNISRLYCDCFNSSLTGKKIGPAPGFEVDPEQHPETIKVAADRRSASAQFHYSIQVGTPMAPDSQLVQMARLHGGGIAHRCEGGIYDVSYVKDARDGSWKIWRLEHRALSQTDYRPGKAYANPISV